VQGKKNGEKRGGCGEKVKNGGEKKIDSYGQLGRLLHAD
jgi:hypothetical protein